MLPDFGRNVHCLLGLPFDAVDLVQAERKVRDAVDRRVPCFFSTPNLNFLIACQSDPAFRGSVFSSDLSVADGTPVIWLARLLRIPIPERVAGSDLFERLRASPESLRVYFFGGPDGVAEAACKKLNEERKGLRCVGFESPGFGSIEEMSSESIIARINQSDADLVVVSLGAKKGQAWIERNRDRLNAPAISHLGAVVNFVAGTVNRAPRLLQRCGLEWLWRIKEEPVLWRRYWGDGIALIRLLTTRVLPDLASKVLSGTKPGHKTAAGLIFQEESRQVSILLSGAWSYQNLGPLRDAYSRAAMSGKPVSLDMAAVTYVDSGFLGLTILLFGHQRRLGQELRVSSLSTSVRRAFKYSCAEYLHAGSD